MSILRKLYRFKRETIYKSFLLFLLCIIFFIFSLQKSYPQQITNAAVIDVAKIYSAFPKFSRGYENLNKLKEQYQKEINDQIDQLEFLKRKRVVALKKKNYTEIKDLDVKIEHMVGYIDSLSKIRQMELQKKSVSPVSKDFLSVLQDAISFVAEEKGYVMVFRANTDGLQWWAPIVDITDDVIKRIRNSN